MHSIVPEQITSYWSNKKGVCCSPLLFVVILSSGLLKVQHLGHPSLHSPDECCHALVAKNLLKHPLKPTLIDTPYLPTFAFDWGANHIWLHKPILGLWQIAGSYWLFGVSTWALRFPSVILSTLAVWLTYLIGKELLSRQAGFIAATIQAFSPFLMRLIHGYQFSDAVDVSLLFWTEFAIYFLVQALRREKWRDICLAGFGQGCAFLSKSYLALIVTGLIVTAWVAPALGMAKRADTCISWMQKRKRFTFRIGMILTIVSLIALGVHTIIGAWQVTSRNRNTRTLAETANYAETQLPQNAVLLVELDADKLRNTDDHLRLMFLMSKTAHPLSNPDQWEEKASEVRKAGGIPYLVSFREWSLPVVFTSLTDKRIIYSHEVP